MGRFFAFTFCQVELVSKVFAAIDIRFFVLKLHFILFHSIIHPSYLSPLSFYPFPPSSRLRSSHFHQCIWDNHRPCQRAQIQGFVQRRISGNLMPRCQSSVGTFVDISFFLSFLFLPFLPFLAVITYRST